MNASDDGSCGTDCDTDGFWSSEKTLLESVRGDGDAGAATAVRRRKKKKRAKDRNRKDAAAAAEVPPAGLKRKWTDFLREHDDERRDFWKTGRKCFVDTVRRAARRSGVSVFVSDRRGGSFLVFISISDPCGRGEAGRWFRTRGRSKYETLECGSRPSIVLYRRAYLAFYYVFVVK